MEQDLSATEFAIGTARLRRAKCAQNAGHYAGVAYPMIIQWIGGNHVPIGLRWDPLRGRMTEATRLARSEDYAPIQA